MAPLSVLVVGGGPAGLAAAISFGQGGADVQVVERQREDSPVGSELMLPVMVHPTLRNLGVYDECLKAGVPGDHLALSMGPGAPPMVLPLPGAAPGVWPTGIGITRTALHANLLRAAAQSGAKVRDGTAVVAVDQDETQASAEFEDGSRESYDLVVAADGVGSTVRRQVFGEVPEPTRVGQAVWRARLARSASSCPELTGIFYGRDRLKAGLINVSEDEMYLFLLEPASDGSRIESASFLARLKEALGSFDGYVAEARGRLDVGTHIHYTVLHSLIVPAPWHRGRVVLVGDAAHTVTPHLAYGAGLGLEDGWVLADSVLAATRRGANLEAGLTAYGERRYERCRAAVEACNLLVEGELFPERPNENPITIMTDAWIRFAQPL